MGVFGRKTKPSVEVSANSSHDSPASKARTVVKPAAKNAILWCSVSRQNVTMARIMTSPPHPDAPRLSQQVHKSPSSSGWDFFSFGVDEKKPGIRGCKFHIHQRNPFPNGQMVTIRGYESKLNGDPVRIVSYSPATDHYIVKLVGGDTMSLCSEYIAGQSSRENIVWSYVCIYNDRFITQTGVRNFVEKLAMLSEGFRQDWVNGDRLCGQEVFGEIMEHQVQFFDELGSNAFHDNTLEFSKGIIANNYELISETTF